MSDFSIPHVDLRQLYKDRPRFVEDLGLGLSALGFVAVSGHDIDDGLLSRVYAASREVFGLPPEVKARYEQPESGRQRGYTPYGTERAKDQAVADLKEFWMVGRPDAQDLPTNVFPGEVPAFEAALTEYFRRAESIGLELLGAIAEFLGQPADWLVGLARHGNTVVRVLNYPDLDGPPPAGAVRAAAHEDINLITLLPASTRPGLQLLTRDGRWAPVEAPPGVLIVDTGDMMHHVTAGRMPATTHRVVNPGGSDGGRLSLPCFVHPHPEALLRPLDPAFGAPVKAGDLLAERLRANGVL